MFAGKKSAQIREILISESAWEEMTCLFAPSLVLARCLAQVADKGSQFSTDAARTASAFIEWIPFDAENGTEKMDALIGKYKDHINGFHAERKPDVKGVTLNCLRLYHSDELNKLVPQLIIGNPDRTWIQDNPQ